MAESGPNKERLLNAAAELTDPGERAAFLDSACGGDSDLRSEIEGLLRHDADMARFLSVPALGSTATAPPAALGSEDAGGMVGPYKLVQQIGEGGMGSVWLAQQIEPVKRVVALKLIKAGMDSRQVIARFEAERQALALMDHANIARVLDAGTTQAGRPYFVMDVVKGVPITRYCDEHRLTPRQRLELFIPVCQAVQHAHQKGIIHRDLKPSNVLVALYDGKPVPKVIDFGVAKATGLTLTDKTLVTGFGCIVGTLEYMSPEQAEINQLDIDTRSDIYSLGVLLYELLTGSPPFSRNKLENAGILEMLRIIREQEPPKPSTKLSTAEALPTLAANRGTEPAKLAKLVSGELDWIVMKSLEKDRSRRYETANAFAMDVQRYLADEPVQACPPSARYRLRKFVRRNKGPVVAAGLVLLCLLVGIIGTAAGLLWALRERDAKAAALAAENKARGAEKEARDHAIAALRDMTDDVVENQMARASTLTDENKAFLRKVIKHFEGFAAINALDADSRAIRAEGYLKVGTMGHRLGEPKEAEAAYAAALAIQKQLAADFPNRPGFRQGVAVSHNNLGILLRDTGRLKEAEAAYTAAIAVQKQLAADFPNRPEFRWELARSDNNLGLLLNATGRLKEAEAAYAEALAIGKQLAADFPTRPEFRQELARSDNNLGNLLRDTGRLKEAEAAYTAALAIRKQLAADYPTRTEFRGELAGSHNNLGVLLSATGRPKDAQAAYAAALAIKKQLAADFPTRPEFREELARSDNNLGAFLKATGRPKDAETAFADAVSIQKQLAADFPTRPEFRQELARSENNLGSLLNATGRLKEAEAAYAGAVSIQKQLAADFPTRPEFRRELARSENNLGLLLQATGRLKGAEAAYAGALVIREQLAADFPTRPEFRLELARSHDSLGSLLRDTGRLKEAEAAYSAALAISKQLATEFPTRSDVHEVLAGSDNNLAILLKHTGRFKEAEAAYADALAIQKRLAANSPNRPNARNGLAGTFVNLAVLCQERGDFAQANAYLEQAEPHHQAALKAYPRNPNYRQFYQNNLLVLVGARAGISDQAGAVRAAARLRDLGWDPPADAYNAACALSRCVAIVRKNSERAIRAERDTAMRLYADEAMKTLRVAVAKGYNDAAHMNQDKDLDALREREDFKKLLAGMEAKQNGPAVSNHSSKNH